MDAVRALNPPAFEQGPPAEGTPRPTPVMEQYIEIKAANPDCLLFYRMGDFYELFFEDAEVAARALGIVLTKRGKHLGRDIPMCGVPVHRADEYLQRLIMQGYRVAVCEQLEDPAEARRRGGKAVVRRDVVRLVTPGTLTEDALLDPRRNNYLVAVARARASGGDESRFALAWIDISTGEFRLAERDRAGVAAELARLEPGEIIVSDALYDDPELAPYLRSLPHVTPLARDVFDGSTAERRLAGYFGVSSTEGFGALSRLELTAAAACITYIERTQLGERPPLSPPAREAQGATLQIDQATRANLELVRTLAGERRGSLLAAIDRSVTAAGSRLLAQRLAAPLTDPQAIAVRHNAVAYLVADASLRADLRARLRSAPDLARALARLVVERGGPRDLAAIRDGVLAAADLARALSSLKDTPAEIALVIYQLTKRREAAGCGRELNKASAEPSVLAPNLPTVAATVTGYESVQTYGMFAPTRTPAGTRSSRSTSRARTATSTPARCAPCCRPGSRVPCRRSPNAVKHRPTPARALRPARSAQRSCRPGRDPRPSRSRVRCTSPVPTTARRSACQSSSPRSPGRSTSATS